MPGLPGLVGEDRVSLFRITSEKDVTIFDLTGAPSGGVARIHPYVQTVRAELAYNSAGQGGARQRRHMACGAVPAAYNWTGFYIGAGGGYGMFNLDSSLTQSGALRSDNQALGGRGWFGTGFDYQFAGRRRIRGLGFLRHSRQLARSLLGSGPIKQKWAWFTTQKNRIPRDR